MNGPQLGRLRSDAALVSATLQGYLLPAGVVSLIGYKMTGLRIPPVTHLYLISLPASLPAIFLGGALNRRLRPEAFLRYVYVGLALIAWSILCSDNARSVGILRRSLEGRARLPPVRAGAAMGSHRGCPTF